MGKPLLMSIETYGGWYEVINRTQPDGAGLEGTDRDKFNKAFDSYTAGSHDIAFKGFLELSEKGSSISQYFLGVMYLKGKEMSVNQVVEAQKLARECVARNYRGC